MVCVYMEFNDGEDVLNYWEMRKDCFIVLNWCEL